MNQGLYWIIRSELCLNTILLLFVFIRHDFVHKIVYKVVSNLYKLIQIILKITIKLESQANPTEKTLKQSMLLTQSECYMHSLPITAFHTTDGSCTSS